MILLPSDNIWRLNGNWGVTKKNIEAIFGTRWFWNDFLSFFSFYFTAKLYDILHGMISEIPGDKICLEWLAILKPNNTWKKNSVEYSPWFSSCASLPRIPAHSLVTLAKDQNHRPKFIAKKSICSTLKAFILEQTVSMRIFQFSLARDFFFKSI